MTKVENWENLWAGRGSKQAVGVALVGRVGTVAGRVGGGGGQRLSLPLRESAPPYGVKEADWPGLSAAAAARGRAGAAT